MAHLALLNCVLILAAVLYRRRRAGRAGSKRKF